MPLFLCVPVWLGFWPRSDVGVRICQIGCFSKQGYKEVLPVCVSHSWKILLMMVVLLFAYFFLPDVLFCQEVTGTVCQEKPSCHSYPPHTCRPGHGSDVCSLLASAGGPLPVKVLRVTLWTLNIADVAQAICLALWATSQKSCLPASQLVLRPPREKGAVCF